MSGGGEAYLNALLDKYIQKYQVPPQTHVPTPAAAFAATIPTSPAKAAPPVLPSASSATTPVSALPTLTPAQQATLAQATLSAIGPQPTPVAAHASANPNSVVAPASSLAATSTNATLNLSHPAALYHQTDLSIIQSQIEQLSKKLQRVPETVTDPVLTNKLLSHSASSSASGVATHQPPSAAVTTVPVVSAPVGVAPLSSGGVYQPALSHGASVGGNTRIVYQVPGAGASVQYTQQPHHYQQQQQQPSFQQEQKQMQMNELLDASSFATNPSIPTSSSSAIAQQAADTLEAQRVSIAASVQALTSSPPRAAARRTSASPSPAASPHSREGLKAQLAAAQKQISKQSMQISEKEFALVTAHRDVETLRGKVDKFSVLQRAHNTLKAEHAAVCKNLEKSERIRREQLNYIQILHSQIQFLQNTPSSGMLQNSPIKNGIGNSTDEDKFNEALGQMLSPQQREQQRLFREAADSLTLPQFAGSADAGLTLGHVDPSESQPFASFSPARASIPSRAVKLHDDVVRDNAEIAAAARVGSKVLKESGRPFIPALDLSPERVNAQQQQKKSNALNASAQPLSPDFKHIPVSVSQYAASNGTVAAARKQTAVDDSPVSSSPSISLRPRLSSTMARSASMKKASPSVATRSVVRPSTAAPTRPVSASAKKKPTSTTLNTSTTVNRTRPSTASSTTRTSLSHKPTRSALAASRKP